MIDPNDIPPDTDGDGIPDDQDDWPRDNKYKARWRHIRETLWAFSPLLWLPAFMVLGWLAWRVSQR